MAGLAELLLGKSNPFSQFISENQNKVHAAFGGLGSGTNFNEGLSRAAQGAALASPLDQAAAEKRQLANEGITARNRSVDWLRTQPGGEKFAAMLENGLIDGSTAVKSWLDASRGAGGGEAFTLGPDQTRFAPDGSVLATGVPSTPDPKDAFNMEKDLSAQYIGADPVKTYQTVRNAFEKVRSSAVLGTGPGDISTIFAYMKMLDPGSVVREQEFATASNSGGVPESVRGLYNSLLNGEFLTPELRRQFTNAANSIYADASNNLVDHNNQYTNRATGWNVDPTRFIMTPETYENIDPLNIRGGGR
jgi:hypothetical protein